MDTTIRVTILGREYPLRVDAAHEAFTRRVAALVDERIQAVERQAPGHPDLTHAVIAAMSLAEELLSLRESGLAGEDPSPPSASTAEDGVLCALAAEADALATRLDAVLGASGANPERGSNVPPSPPTGEDD